MDPKPIRGRKHRLPREHYVGQKAVAFTCCLEPRVAALADREVVEAFVPVLARSSKRYDCTIPIYTFMPDHLHVLVVSEGVESDTLAVMDAFKIVTGRWWKRHRDGLRWESDYWDHIVREAEGWQAQARYIAANPCRRGLCKDVLAWPFTGSIGYDLNDVIGEAFW